MYLKQTYTLHLTIYIMYLFVNESCTPTKRYLYKDFKMVVNSAQEALKAENARDITVKYKDSSSVIINGSWFVTGATIKVINKPTKYYPRTMVRMSIRQLIGSNQRIAESQLLNRMGCQLQDFGIIDLNAK